MSGRSSARELIALLAIAACGKSSGAGGASAAPEADPARIVPLAAAMLANAPGPGSARDCTAADFAGGLSMTQPTLLRLAGKAVADDPEHAAWINPAEFDAPVARTLIDPHTPPAAARQAAAAFLAAPFYIVYRVDNVDAPLALGVKELKIGTIGTRVIRYDKAAHPACVKVFFFQNDKAVSAAAIAASDKTLVDPAVAERLRQDLAAQYVKLAPR